MVDAWLVSHSVPNGAAATTPSASCADAELASPGGTASAAGSGVPSKTGSGAATPVRKVSAHEFERGGLLRPLVSNVDGTLTFISPTLSEDAHALISHYAKPRRRNRHELRSLDEKELIFELVKDICNDLDVRSLCHKILQVSAPPARSSHAPCPAPGARQASQKRCLIGAFSCRQPARTHFPRPNPVYTINKERACLAAS